MRRKPSRFPFPLVRSRRSRQTNLCSQTHRGGSTTTRKRRSGWQVLEEKVGANYKNRYVWSPSYIDALVTRDRDTDANGTLDERLFAQHDANFNVTAITNTSGTVQERYTPDPFGVVTFRDASGNTISASAKDWVFLHQGGQADILGHYDFRNRILSPTLGRWLTNDPLGFDAGDNNFYGYLANGPGNGLDPSGLEKILVIMSSRHKDDGKDIWGHVVLVIIDPEAEKMETYSLYPDVKDINENSNVIKNSELDDPLKNEYPYKRAVFISDAMHDRFLDLVNQDYDWRYDQNCAEFGREIFRKVTGEEIEMDDRFGYETPRMVGKGIKDNNGGRDDNVNPKWWFPIDRKPPFKGPRNRRNSSDGSSYDGSY